VRDKLGGGFSFFRQNRAQVEFSAPFELRDQPIGVIDARVEPIALRPVEEGARFRVAQVNEDPDGRLEREKDVALRDMSHGRHVAPVEVVGHVEEDGVGVGDARPVSRYFARSCRARLQIEAGLAPPAEVVGPENDQLLF